jgi:hypothetical protein
VLPESHTGSRVELDRYFTTKTLPLARRSRTLISEAAQLDTNPGSPLWGRTCLDENPALSDLSREMALRIVRHNQYSQWADLRREFAVHHDHIRADEMFFAFINARGAMLNFWEIFWRIEPGLEKDMLLRASRAPKLVALQYRVDTGPRARIARAVPELTVESIETLSDFSSALCELSHIEQHQAVSAVISGMDRLEARLRARQAYRHDWAMSALFSIMRRQLGACTAQDDCEISPGVNAAGKLRSMPIEQDPLQAGIDPALDKALLGMRNQRWAKRIDEHARARRQGLLYVLGVAHMLDFEHFDGLPTLLKQRGFHVEVVR